jgi:hypothetical protein
MRFDETTQTLLDWLVRHAASDTLETNPSAYEYVTADGTLCACGDWLVKAGVPTGWLRLQAGKDVEQVLLDAWADGLLRLRDREATLLGRLAARLQVVSDAGVPWGAAAAHVLLLLADVASPDMLEADRLPD